MQGLSYNAFQTGNTSAPGLYHDIVRTTLGEGFADPETANVYLQARIKLPQAHGGIRWNLAEAY
jgi:hypothetical protein